jgi:hypothetical protein
VSLSMRAFGDWKFSMSRSWNVDLDWKFWRALCEWKFSHSAGDWKFDWKF